MSNYMKSGWPVKCPVPAPAVHIPPPMPTPPPRPPLPDAARLLAMPAPQGARLVLRAALQATAESVEAARAGTPDATLTLAAALHRLHDLLQWWGDALRDTVPGTALRRTTALARLVGTDASRLRLHAMCAALADDTGPAAQLPAPVHQGTTGQRVIAERWTPIHAALETALATWHERHAIDAGRTTPPFGALAAASLDRAIERFEKRWAALESPEDTRAVHVAHGAACALHHVLGPVAAATPAGIEMDAAVASLCGHLDDVTTAASLRAMITPDSQPLLHRHLGARIAGHIRALGMWTVQRQRTHALATLRAVAEAWRAASAPPVEIERKWLLSALPPRAAEVTPDELAQGYLPGSELVERIRSITRGDDVTWVRTVKLGTGQARIEVEEETPSYIAVPLFALTRGKRVLKRRHTVPEGALAWEIDDFADRALVLAELELPATDTPVTIPEWLAPYVVREVTGEREFTNWALAR